LIKIFISWKTIDDDVGYLDLDTHIDIHDSNDKVTPIHLFNYEKIHQKGVHFGPNKGGPIGSPENNSSLSEIIVKRDFNKKSRYQIYLYAYFSNFSEL